MDIEIKNSDAHDVLKITKIWNDIIDEGTSFHWEEHFTSEKVQFILSQQTETYCAYIDNVPVGFYLLHPNSSGKCKHIANALYAVEKEYRGKGIGTKLIKHSLDKAKECGFIAMQYNAVVAENPSISIYRKLGFEQIGIIKNGFKKDSDTFLDLIIFYASL